MNGKTKLVPLMNVSSVRPRRPRGKRVTKINVNQEHEHVWDVVRKDGNRIHIMPF